VRSLRTNPLPQRRNKSAADKETTEFGRDVELAAEKPKQDHLLLVWSVPDRLSALLQRHGFKPTKKNPQHWWRLFQPELEADPLKLRETTKHILGHLRAAGLEFSWRQVPATERRPPKPTLKYPTGRGNPRPSPSTIYGKQGEKRPRGRLAREAYDRERAASATRHYINKTIKGAFAISTALAIEARKQQRANAEALKREGELAKQLQQQIAREQQARADMLVNSTRRLPPGPPTPTPHSHPVARSTGNPDTTPPDQLAQVCHPPASPPLET
jgi:hypothetical protein